MSKRILGDNAGVGFADIFLKRLVLGLSVAVVLLLAGMAIYGLINQAEDPVAAPEGIDDGPSAPVLTYSADRIEVGDLEFPLTVGCVIDRQVDPGGQSAADDREGDVYLVSIHNQGELATDYLVSAVLTSNAGTSVTALARVDELRGGEQREVVLLPNEAISNVSRCAITGVQSDRRVLLSTTG